MNDFKFKDCVDCKNVGRGMTLKLCRSCVAGENFQERVVDTVDEMMREERSIPGYYVDGGVL